MFILLLYFRPSCAASNSVILLVVMPNDLAFFRIQFLDSSLIINPILAIPEFLLDAPLKLSFFHLVGGGSHLHSLLSLQSFFLIIERGLIKCCQFFLIFASHSVNEPSSLVVILRQLLMTSVMLASILLKNEFVFNLVLLKILLFLSFHISQIRIAGVIFHNFP